MNPHHDSENGRLPDLRLRTTSAAIIHQAPKPHAMVANGKTAVTSEGSATPRSTLT